MVLFWNTILSYWPPPSVSLKTVRPLSLAFFFNFPCEIILYIGRANDHRKMLLLWFKCLFVCLFLLFNWMKLEIMICRIYTVSSLFFFSLFVIFALIFFFSFSFCLLAQFSCFVFVFKFASVNDCLSLSLLLVFEYYLLFLMQIKLISLFQLILLQWT
jgi:hypothetical protein